MIKNRVLVHNYALQGYTGPGTIWGNEINFVTNQRPGAGTIATTALQLPPNSIQKFY